MEALVYTKHSPDCPQKSNKNWRRCRCPKWLYIARERRRISAKTRSWEKAEQYAISLNEDNGVTVGFAIKDFLKDKSEQNVSDEWLEKLEFDFDKTLKTWCPVTYLGELSIDLLKEYRSTWTGNALTRAKKQERLRSFFLYCQRHGWIKDNPARLLSRIKVDRVPTDYFTPDEMDKVLGAVDSSYVIWRDRTRAMILLLRWSGLRLGDAARLERSRLDKTGRLFLYMAKTREPVYVVLPPHVTDALHKLENSNPRYFFWTGNGHNKSTVDDWWRTLSGIFKKAELGKRAHPHMFRDTFAIELLLAGVDIKIVSVLLGHKNIKITEDHYAPWVRARQEQLEASVRMAWSGSSRVPAP